MAIDMTTTEIEQPPEDFLPAALEMMPRILEQANAEIASVLRGLRQCRTQLASATNDRLQITHEKLREVSSATELAATDILDGLDRAQGLIDELDGDAEASGCGSEQGVALRNRLRDELFTITGCLQFQDITTQQLTYAGTVLTEMEDRLSEITRLIDPFRSGASDPSRGAPAGPASVTYSPDAAYTDASDRQAEADDIVAGHGGAATAAGAR